MLLTLVNPPYDTEVDVAMKVPTDNTQCSLCENRPPVFFMDDAMVTESQDPTKLPLGGPNSCTECLNYLLENGWVQIIRVDPNSF